MISRLSRLHDKVQRPVDDDQPASEEDGCVQDQPTKGRIFGFRAHDRPTLEEYHIDHVRGRMRADVQSQENADGSIQDRIAGQRWAQLD